MCHCGQIASDVLDLRRDMLWLREHVHRIEMQQEEFHMSEDAAIQAVTADITAQLTTLSGLIRQVLAEVGSGSGTVQPSTVAALQAAQSELDSVVSGFGASLNPPASDVVTVTDPGDQTSSIAAGPVSLQIQATDSVASEVLSYTASGLPDGLAIDSGSGLISGTPTTEGVSSVVVTAMDSTAAGNGVSFNWTVTV